ncbi:MAG: ABC transporter ATP-binding protein [Weeksellaceae bacterium]|nr:ABC transporter ATP-binding protein [Weeksellaceae bacterium]
MKTILNINNLSKNFGRLQAVKDLSLNVERGNVYGLLGPNGSGKSTTLGMILGVVNPSSGDWEWFEGVEQHQALRKIGAIIENPKFYPYLSAYRNLQIVAQIKEVPDSKIDEKLELVGLLDRKNDKYAGFSLGMKQRLAIAGALLNDPHVLILDEPTNGLDPQGIHQIRGLIKTIAAQGTSIILASHLLDEVEKVCSHVVVLRKGQSLYQGSVAGLLADSGYFEIGSEDTERLLSVLKNWSAISEMENVSENQWRIYTHDPITGTQINQYLHQNGVAINHLVHKQASLEDKFIAITQS